MNEQTQPALAGQVDRHVRPLVERLETAAHAWQHSLTVSREFLPSPDMLREAKAEIARLTDALRQANDQAERFERGWYLRGDALLALRSEPVQQGGWHDAAQWLRDNYQDHQTIAGLCDAMVAAAPVQRKPLTEDEIEALFEGVDSDDKGRFAIVREFARAIEAAHGIKGGGNG